MLAAIKYNEYIWIYYDEKNKGDIMYKLNPELYNYIFEELNAVNQPDPKKAKYNLDNDEEESKRYLGTYFPRSYRESCEIFVNIFDCLSKYGYFNFKDNKINILDLGSGSGGQLFGLLHILTKKMTQEQEINVFSIDGNEIALDIQKKIFKYVSEKKIYKHRVRHHTYLKTFDNGDNLTEFLKKEFYDIDIILSFKFISELLRCEQNAYTSVLKSAEDILSPNGIMAIVDVTDKAPIEYKNTYMIPSYSNQKLNIALKHPICVLEWIPSHFNQELRSYLSEYKGKTQLRLVLPSCCSKNIDKCNDDTCYKQLGINVFYKDTQNKTKSKIDYKLFIKDGNLYEKFYDDYMIKNYTSCSETCETKNIGNHLCYCDKIYPHKTGETHPLNTKNTNIHFKQTPFAFKI